MPSWQREALPLLFCGDALAAVPGLGVDVAFQAHAGRAGFHLGLAACPLTALARTKRSNTVLVTASTRQ